MSTNLMSFQDHSDESLRDQAEAALLGGDFRRMIDIGGELERRGMFSLAWSCLGQGSRSRKSPAFGKWEGPQHSISRLLVRRRMRHLGAELRNARFINNALRSVGEVIIATEPRLMPLFERSFPAATIVNADDYPHFEGIEAEVSYEELAYWFGRTDSEIRDSFVPLQAPGGARGSPTAIGIAWHSVNGRKRLPTLEDWSEPLRQVDAPLRSLQYSEVEAGLSTLSELCGKSIDSSTPVDQLKDVDGFAGQVARVRGVLTISNTTAHMAGALGIPCVVLLDDVEHLTWPLRGEKTPFYPAMHLLRQRGRPWRQVVDEGLGILQDLMGQPGSGSPNADQ